MGPGKGDAAVPLNDMDNTNQKHTRHSLEGDASPAAVFLKTAKIEENYGSKWYMYTTIYQIGRSIGVKELANALFVSIDFLDRKH